MNKTHRLELKNSPWPSGSWHTLVSESERGRERERERERPLLKRFNPATLPNVTESGTPFFRSFTTFAHGPSPGTPLYRHDAHSVLPSLHARPLTGTMSMSMSISSISSSPSPSHPDPVPVQQSGSSIARLPISTRLPLPSSSPPPPPSSSSSAPYSASALSLRCLCKKEEEEGSRLRGPTLTSTSSRSPFSLPLERLITRLPTPESNSSPPQRPP